MCWVNLEAIPYRLRHAPHVKIYEDVLSRMCNADVGKFIYGGKNSVKIASGRPARNSTT